MPVNKTRTNTRRRYTRANRSTRGGALLLSVAIIMALCFLTMLVTLCVSNIAMQAFYNDKASMLATNTLACYTAETGWYSAATTAPATAQTTVQSELNDALALMSMPNGTFSLSNPSPPVLASQVSVLGLTSIGNCGLFPTLLNTSQSAITGTPVLGTVREAVVIPTASGNFSLPACGSLGQIAVTPALPGYISPLETGTFCQANFFQFQVPFDEYDLTFTQYYHLCPTPGCCVGSPCQFLTCGGTHPGPPPVPPSPPIPFEKCEQNP